MRSDSRWRNVLDIAVHEIARDAGGVGCAELWAYPHNPLDAEDASRLYLVSRWVHEVTSDEAENKDWSRRAFAL